MDLKGKMAVLTENFNKLQEVINQKNEQIKTINGELAELFQEVNRMQGEYRLLDSLIKESEQEVVVPEVVE